MKITTTFHPASPAATVLGMQGSALSALGDIFLVCPMRSAHVSVPTLDAFGVVPTLDAFGVVGVSGIRSWSPPV